jgi:urease accessory protein
VRVLGPGHWPEGEAVGTVTLPYEGRHRRRMRMDDDAGLGFLLDLPRAVLLAEGDGLALDAGGYLRVRAAAEDLAEIRCRTAVDLARVAWHLGNRHLPVQLAEDAIRLRWDGVIVDMLRGLGAEVRRVSAPFAPEGGAYSGDHHGHGHDHDDHDHDDHDHDHDHEHGHEHGHDR